MDLYDEFKFNNLRLEFVPLLSINSSGAVAAYFDPDTKPTLPARFEEISGNYGVASTQVYHRKVVAISRERLHRLPWYQTHQTDATGTQGNLVFLNTSGTVPEANGTSAIGMWWMEYDITLRSPSRPTNPRILDNHSRDLGERAPNQMVVQLEAQTRELANIRRQLDIPLSSLQGNPAVQAIAETTDDLLYQTQQLTNQLKQLDPAQWGRIGDRLWTGSMSGAIIDSGRGWGFRTYNQGAQREIYSPTPLSSLPTAPPTSGPMYHSSTWEPTQSNQQEEDTLSTVRVLP